MLQELDLAAAARDLPSAVSWLHVAESVGALLDRDASGLVMEVADFPGWRHSYDAAVGLRKQRLVRGGTGGTPLPAGSTTAGGWAGSHPSPAPGPGVHRAVARPWTL